MYEYQAEIRIFKASNNRVRQGHYHTQNKMLKGCSVYHGIILLAEFESTDKIIKLQYGNRRIFNNKLNGWVISKVLGFFG
jgi:hypothetical protein